MHMVNTVDWDICGVCSTFDMCHVGLIKFIEVVKGGAGYSNAAKGSMVSKWEWVDI